jgi:hypothetical protein
VILGDVDTRQQHRYPDDTTNDTNCAHIVPLSLGDGKSNETTVAMIWVAILPEATILPRHTGNKDSAK